jgi:phage FluMu protein Com
MDDAIQIRCSRCNSRVRDRARRVRGGYTRECPSCNVLIFFESESHEDDIKRALKAAHKMRRLVAEAEGVQPSTKQAPTYIRTSSKTAARIYARLILRVIASEAKQSNSHNKGWIASSLRASQ